MSDVSKKVEEMVATIDFKTTRYELELQTSLGNIQLEVYPDKAPNHSKNILALAKVGFYDNLIFHRVIPGFMIQGGCPDGTGMGGPGYNVDAEFNDASHTPGVLSMARAQDPNSAGSQFFICLETVPHLDGQYTVFGKTINDESLAVVKKIGAVATGPQDRPHEDVKIQKAIVTETAL